MVLICYHLLSWPYKTNFIFKSKWIQEKNFKKQLYSLTFQSQINEKRIISKGIQVLSVRGKLKICFDFPVNLLLKINETYKLVFLVTPFNDVEELFDMHC